MNKNITLILAFAIIAQLSTNSSAARQPNIIYINTDDWGIGKVPCYKMDAASEKIIKTPNIDRLRKEGMLFSDAYAGNAVCGPSRCSLLTGKHPGNAAWRANHKNPPVKTWPPEAPMLGEVARQAGYKTAAFGKITAGGTDTPENITNYGWDYWLGFLGHVDCRNYYASSIWENGKKISLPKNTQEALKGTSIQGKSKGTGVVADGKGTFIEDLYTDRIIEFITENKAKPFFVYYASVVPHGGPPGGMRVPDLEGYDKEDLTLKEQVYCALLTRHDKNVGRLMKAVHNLGLDENTIIIWTSDNGDEDSYYERTKTFDGNGIYRAEKRSLYEGGIRVPMIARWPGTIKGGTQSDLQTTQWDLMPTLADAGGKPITKEMDGISIMPTLMGLPDKQSQRDYLYFEFYEVSQQQSVRIGDWKGYRTGGWDGKIELYDLGKDIGETKDLAHAHPELVEKIKGIMKKEHSPHPYWNLNPKNNGVRKPRKKKK